MLEINQIHQGDCMLLMKNIPDKSVNMILADLPYGTTQNEWDTVLPLDDLWKEYERIITDNGIIVLTSDSIFSAKLIMSNQKLYRYSLVWDKVGTTGFLNANRMPLRRHEDILVFYKKLGTYNPIMSNGTPYKIKHRPKTSNYGDFDENYGTDNKGGRFPTSIITFFQKRNPNGHPTQKPVELFRYLIKTYSNEGDIILDNCIGSGTTAVACKQLRRNFIGIELNQEYVEMAQKRLGQEVLFPLAEQQEGGAIPPKDKSLGILANFYEKTKNREDNCKSNP